MDPHRRSAPSRAGSGRISTRSSSAPAFPASTSSTSCANSASRCGCSKPAPASAAPGTGTAIPAPASIPKAGPTAIRSRRSCSRNGTGPSTSRAQPETERYSNYVADKFDLRRDIQFNSRVDGRALPGGNAQLGRSRWRTAGATRTRFLITAIGVLSAPTMPTIPGVDTFKGQSCHTHYWPKEPVDFEGKRVGGDRHRRDRRCRPSRRSPRPSAI